ncbi:MAG: hypothetical protein Q4D02_04645 [Clostridia bacterium]|nr:hypothetical protein [Clostridia bacterium]
MIIMFTDGKDEPMDEKAKDEERKVIEAIEKLSETLEYSKKE